MFWFDKQDERVTFGDMRQESHILCDGRTLTIAPDICADFRDLPFADGSYKLVVFDPPHLKTCGPQGWQGKKYGILSEDWRDDIRKGFTECFRVLAADGVLIFKWAEVQIKTSEILSLTPHKPLFGHISGKSANTHWVTFMKSAA